MSASVTVVALRGNNLKMIQLRDDVYQADQQNGDVEAALLQLRKYVYAHMNTDLSSGQGAVYPPIQLKYTYDRLKQAEQARVKQATSQIYTDAQNYCEQQDPTSFSGRNRVPCIEAYVSEHKATEATIPDALYKFDFISPKWSPDYAGISLLVSCLLLLLLILRITAGRILKRLTS
jgi:hypothetical protein